MEDKPKDQKILWELQHDERKIESQDIEGIPNLFAKRCIELLPENALIIDIGTANGRDARFFAREKHCRIVATDFALNALRQLKEASGRDATSDKVFPVVADARALPLGQPQSIDAIYSRSALHLTDEELDYFFEECVKLLKDDGYIMIEGKTEEDPKIATSKELSPHLYENGRGHLRRVWSEIIIKDLVQKHSLNLLELNTTSEVWNQLETRFINFIAQKPEIHEAGN